MKFASIYRAAHEFLRRHAGEEVLVVAMERAAADDIVRSLGGSQLGVHRYSLRQLITAMGRDALAGTGKRPLTTLAAQALAAQVVDRTQLGYFAPVARTPGFPAALVNTLTRLRLERQQAPSGDLERLASAYRGALAESGLADTATELEAAIATARAGKHPLSGLPTLLIDLRPANVLEREFVLAMSDRATALSAERDDAAHDSALEALQRQLFMEEARTPRTREGVDFFSAAGESLECVEIARYVLESGYRFDQCAILLRNPGRYQPLVEDALRRAEIPAWFTRGSVRPDSAGRSFLALLHCAEEGLSASRFAEYLSHEQKEQPYGWERLLVDASVIGGKDRWERRLAGLAEELRARLAEAEDEPARERVERQLERLVNLREFALPIIQALAELRTPRRWGEWLDGLRELAEWALEDPAGVVGLLDELEPMRDVGPVGLPEVCRLVSAHLGTLRREPEGRRYGRVFVGSIEEARGLTFQLVCIPGVCEGAFPKPLFDDPLLPGRLAELELEERLRLRQAVAAATARVVISWPRIELATGRLRIPSFYVLEAARAAFGEAFDHRTIERMAEQRVETRIGWPAPHDVGRAIDDTEFDLARLRPAVAGADTPGLAAYITALNPMLHRSLRARWNRWSRKWTHADGLMLSSAGALAAYSLAQRPYSPSTLQLFAACPYRFALRTVLGLLPMERAAALERLDPLTRGTLFHEVHKRLVRRVASLVNAWETLDEVLIETAVEFAERLAPAIPQTWASEVERLRADLRGWLSTIVDDGGSPLEAEREFDNITVGGGWKLRGRMDLVERTNSGAVRVTDYKTGSYPEPPPQVTGAGEVLQPVLYALAAEVLYPDAAIAGGRLFYATLRGGYRSIEVPLNENTREEADRLLSVIDAFIQRGALPAMPREDACEACDYVAVCGPYEEERVRRKPVDAVQGLIQIREVK